MISALRMALRSIASNKMRAFLTMLGIIIGVVALVVLVSVVNGATSSVTSAINDLGSNFLTVSISDDNGKPITLDDITEWEEANNSLDNIAPFSFSSATAKCDDNESYPTIYGVTGSYQDICGLTLKYGRFIKNTDVENASSIAVINETAADELFGYSDCVGSTITLDGMRFKVVGVLDDSDANLTSVVSSENSAVFIPYSMMPRLSSETSSDITSFYVAVDEGHTLDQAEEEINTILYERFGSEDNYSIFSQDSLEDTMSNVSSMFSVMLGGIAAISLVVGGIGIMNIMLVTVTERTREIGIRKAIGAKRKTILGQFLTEAIVICMIGCALGILISWALITAISAVASSLSMSFSMDGTVVVIAILFCFLIGVVFGLYPANKAAKMKPIDALRYNG